MDKVQKLREEVEAEKKRIEEKHNQECMDLQREMWRALENAETLTEKQKVKDESKQKFDLLSKKQSEDYAKLQRDFVRKLQSR